jgi:hypothetical protein
MSEYERPAAGRGAEPPLAHAADAPADVTAPGPEVSTSASAPAGEAPADDVPAAPPIWSATEPAEAAGDPTPAAAAGGRSWLRRPRNLALVSAGVVVLVLALVIGWGVWNEKDVRIATPGRVAGLALDDSQGARDTIDYLRTAVETGVALEKTTGAVYADEAGQSRSVLFIGGTGVVNSPEKALSKTFGLITDDTGGVEGVHQVPPGTLGGLMRCGTTKTEGGSMAVCGWADRGSLGVAMFPNRSPDQAAGLLRTMRQAMQTRS